MAQTAATHDRVDLNANGDIGREDLLDIVYNISPTEVPFQQNIGRSEAYQTLHEWLIDSLADAAANAHIDGDEFAGDALTAGERLGNHCQISRKDLVISRRANIVRKAGRRSELAYQVAKTSRELRRDVEFVLLSNQVAAAGDSTTAPTTAGLPAWAGAAQDGLDAGITNGNTGGVDGVLSGTNDGTITTARVDATAGNRALTEDGLLGVIRAMYESGSDPKLIMCGPATKQRISAFMYGSGARIATPYQDHGKGLKTGASVVGAVDQYVSDFGVLDIVPNRFQRVVSSDDVDVFVLDTDLLAVAYLDGYKTETVAKIGDHERRMVLVDYCLEVKNIGAIGLFADVDDDTAMTAT